jgi:uncharacterized protein YcaQ
MTEMERRLSRLEVIAEHHAEDIAEVKTTSLRLAQELGKIERTLFQIKNIATGALMVLLAEYSGVMGMFLNLLKGM